MTGLAATAALALALGSTGWESGYAVRYAPEKMQRVANIRGIDQQPCMLAWTAARDKDIGRMWLHVAGPAGAAECLVVDLPRPGRDRQNLLRRKVVVELDYESGARVCGPQWEGNARACAVRVIPVRRTKPPDE